MEFFLILSALVITLVSLTIFLKTVKEPDEDDVFITKEETKTPLSQKIFIDISGAVEKPGVYEVTAGARLKDVLILAEGLSAEAERGFFSRNFNLARILTDQEKIYIPSTEEIASGIFMENQRVLNYNQPKIPDFDQLTPQTSVEQKISINTASQEELDTLPGIGKVTAEKIIKNRPYSSIEELLTKKIVGKSVYDKIKDKIAL